MSGVKSMKRFLYIAMLLALLACAATAATAGEVLKIVVDDSINPITEEYIERTLDAAKQNHDDAVLIEISTPGGLLDSTRSIIQKMLGSPVPVIVYVTPSGSRAASAGFFILEAADIAAMSPGTNTGAAHPVILGSTMDDVMKEKLENDAAAFMRSYTSKRGRNVEVAESAVRQSKSFTEQEALQQKLIDVVAKDENDLLQQLDGKTIKRFDGASLTLHLAKDSVRVYDMTLKQRILAYLMDPNITFILLIVGALAIYAEFHTPGAIVPGVIGFIAVLLALFALHLLPTSYAALAMILGSFVLFALEAKFQSHGVLTVGGMVLLVMGALMLVDGPIPEMRVKLLTALAVSIPFGLITVFLMTMALRARRNKVQSGKEGMIGELGVVQMPLAPEGKVFIQGELWNAVSATPIEAGAKVRVRAIKGLQLEVEPTTPHEAIKNS
jgi:membrane-bound serine protease (ClpP class)